MISGNMVGSYSQIGKTFVIQDENGNEITGVVVDQETVFTATDKDVMTGAIYASDSGVSVGSRDFIPYRTSQSNRCILPGENFSIELAPYDKYNYTKFQCMIAKYNTCAEDSCYVDKISLNDAVFEVNSLDKLSDITKNSVSKSIDLNIINDTDDIYVIHYSTYKQEEY